MRAIPDELIEAARQPLDWERAASLSAAPVLDLSRVRETMLDVDESGSTAEDSPEEEDVALWANGQRWEATAQALDVDFNVGPDRTSAMLSTVPQLLRLETEVVLASADALVGITGRAGAGLHVLDSHPHLITYSSVQLEAGVQYLITMMGGLPRSSVISTCALSPDLLVMGTAEAINQERISAALSSAGAATSRA